MSQAFSPRTGPSPLSPVDSAVPPVSPVPLLVLAAVVSLAGCAPDDREAALARRVEDAVAPLVAAHQFSGAIVLTRGGEVVFRRGYGMANHDAAVPFTPDTPSDGGSLAKTFTAAALQWLAHEGRVDLDAPVSRYLPDFPHAGTTLRHLISHSNGLPPDYAFFDAHFAPTDLRTTEAMLRVLARTQPMPAFPPGSRFEYSNFAWDLAALVIERVTGRPYETVLRERFFSRLSMQASFARPARLADWRGVRTLGYRWHDGRWTLVDVFDFEVFLGASNLYFSAADLGRWASASAGGRVRQQQLAAAMADRDGAADAGRCPGGAHARARHARGVGGDDRGDVADRRRYLCRRRHRHAADHPRPRGLLRPSRRGADVAGVSARRNRAVRARVRPLAGLQRRRAAGSRPRPVAGRGCDRPQGWRARGRRPARPGHCSDCRIAASAIE